MRALVIAFVIAASASARADSCPPSVVLDGDPALVAQLGTMLAKRGIAVTGPCPSHVVHVEWRDDRLVVSIASASRTVRELQTAATVIESFVREDVASPLLEIRPIVVARPRSIEKEVAPRARPRPPEGWHLFGGLESSFANDGTRWMGASVGACVMLGPLCGAVRLRGNAVENERGVWGTTSRKSAEVMFGFDVPFRAGRFLLSPGVAAGYGALTTDEDAASRSNNLRAQAHVTLSIPLTRSLAVDVFVTGTLAQQVEREPGYMTTIEEPFGFMRFGLGMRYGER